MNVGSRYRNAQPAAVALAAPFPVVFGMDSMREKVFIVRDTLIVLGMQIVFRVTMLLRQLNY